MTKKHDENKDLRLISRIAKIDYSTKTIQAPRSTVIGIRSWGRIDFLTRHCGWSFFWNNNVKVSTRLVTSDDVIKHKRDAKKAAKENTLTDKRKKK